MARILLDSKGAPVTRGGSEIWTSGEATLVKSVDTDKRILTITGSTEARDRDGDVIRASGWVLDHYKKNPVFLWAHDYASVPLGAAKSVKKKSNPSRLDFEIRFPREGLFPFADMILELYKDGIVSASSVGFLPYKWKELDKSQYEGKEGYDPPWTCFEFVKQELLELSGCAVPSNPEALQNAVKAKSKGFGLADDAMNYLFGAKSVDPDEFRELMGSIKEKVLDALNVKDLEIEGERPVMIQVPDSIQPETRSAPGETIKQVEQDADADAEEDGENLLEGEGDQDKAEGAPADLPKSGPDNDVPTEEGPTEEKAQESKAGAVLSKKNKDRLKSVQAVLKSAHEIIEAVLLDAGEAGAGDEEPADGKSVSPQPEEAKSEVQERGARESAPNAPDEPNVFGQILDGVADEPSQRATDLTVSKAAAAAVAIETLNKTLDKLLEVYGRFGK